MQRFVVNPETIAPPAGNYSHSVRIQMPGAAWVFVAGQVSIEPSGEFVGEGDLRRQTEQVFQVVRARHVPTEFNQDRLQVLLCRLLATETNEVIHRRPAGRQLSSAAKIDVGFLHPFAGCPFHTGPFPWP